jgi:hypothetical protein
MSLKSPTPEELAKLDEAFLQNLSTNPNPTPPETNYKTYLIVIIALLSFLIFVRVAFILIKYSVQILTSIKDWFTKSPRTTVVITK